MKKNKLNNNSHKKTAKANAEKETDKDSKDKEVELLDEEEQGFGGWLRSSEGLETMKLFVLANSIVLLTTLAYPNFQVVVNIVYDMIYGVIFWFSINVFNIISDYFSRQFRRLVMNKTASVNDDDDF